MRSVLKNIAFFTIVVNLFFGNIYSQTNTPDLSETNKRDSINVISIEFVVSDDLPWANSLYISGGYGTLQGLRLELGYNFDTNISFALAYGKYDNWSRNPENGSIGITVKIHVLQFQSIMSYILFGFGSTVDSRGDRVYKYGLIHIGSKIPLANWLQLCPELGFVIASRLSSGDRILIGSPPQVTLSKKSFGFYLSLEMDFRQIF